MPSYGNSEKFPLLITLAVLLRVSIVSGQGVPQGCTSYTNLTDAERNVNYVATTSQCDTSLMGWYRFTDAAGLAMPDSCPREGSRCGASGAGWVNGNHPTAAEEVVTRPVCFSHGDNCCHWMGVIKVINCSGFYVYELSSTPTCNVRYCGTKVVSGTVPIECASNGYIELGEASRYWLNRNGNNTYCDKSIVVNDNWYRFIGSAGVMMASHCFPRGSCGSNDACAASAGSDTCICPSGYAGVPCSDKDECSENSHTCSAYANCTNTVGSFNCTCRIGYSGNGASCSTLNGSSIDSRQWTFDSNDERVMMSQSC
ncbi:PREDICTED: uromodulin-like [Acropora digitifera]|uniref:uromodulin-like n=1 Tax=Acropora digitifera TaxID=70779 RepID=UPI00077A5401|nr:PREDICTED: uromodulin-like [Acropora digitifera]